MTRKTFLLALVYKKAPLYDTLGDPTFGHAGFVVVAVGRVAIGAAEGFFITGAFCFLSAFGMPSAAAGRVPPNSSVRQAPLVRARGYASAPISFGG